MALHIVHFIGPINHNSASAIRNNCLQALQNGATEIELHMSSEGGNMTAGFALYFFLKSLPVPLTTHNIGSVESVAVVIFLAGQKRYACPGTRFLIHPLHWGFGSLVAADHSRVSEWRDCLDFDAERYARIFLEATTAAGSATDIRANLTGNARASSTPTKRYRPASCTAQCKQPCQATVRPATGGIDNANCRLSKLLFQPNNGVRTLPP